MKACSFLAVVVVMLGPLIDAQGGLRFGFMLDRNAYQATDIVVGTEGTRIDGEVAVVEVWRGALRPGDTLHLPELAVFTNTDLRTEGGTGRWQEWRRTFDTNPPVVVDGQRMILFLKRGNSGTRPLHEHDNRVSSNWEWAADFNGAHASVAWVAGGKVYTFQQMNSEPLVLCQHPRSEEEMKRRALQVSDERQALEKIGQVTNAADRARLAAPFVNSNGLYSASTAFNILSGCKTDGIPALRQILNDPTRTNLHDAAVAALAFAGDRDIENELRRSLQAEAEFWKGVGPRLPLNWWDRVELEDPPVRLCRDHYGRLLDQLQLLWLVRFPELDPLVKEIRECWLLSPQLDDALKGRGSDGKRVGHSQVVEFADRVLSRARL